MSEQPDDKRQITMRDAVVLERETYSKLKADIAAGVAAEAAENATTDDLWQRLYEVAWKLQQSGKHEYRRAAVSVNQQVEHEIDALLLTANHAIAIATGDSLHEALAALLAECQRLGY